MTQQEQVSTARLWIENQRTAASKAREYALSHEFRLMDRVQTAFGAGSIIGFNPTNPEGLTHQVLLDSYPEPMGFKPFELQPAPTGNPIEVRR